jgi:phosphoglycolate phosphatase
VKLIIFDCDGTLVDSQHGIVHSMKTAYETVGVEWPGRESTLSIVGLSLIEAMQQMVPDLDEKTHKALAEAYKATFKQARLGRLHEEALYEGCREVLDRYHAMDDVMMAIATGKSQRGVRALIESEGLEGYFQSIQTADDAPSKPHPAMIHQAIAETGAQVDRTVMIGDTSYDMAMARSAGVGAIGVSWGYHPVKYIEASGAHHILHHYNELEAVVKTWFGGAHG